MFKVILLLTFMYQVAVPDNSREATPGKKHEQIFRFKNDDHTVVDKQTKKEVLVKHNIYCGMAYEQKDGKHWKVFIASTNTYSQSFDTRVEALKWFTMYCPEEK